MKRTEVKAARSGWNNSEEFLVSTLLDAEHESAIGGEYATHREVMKKMRSRIADSNEQRFIEGIKKLVG
ncbi:MAG TPA: hypothetical protein PLV42_00290 [bacterium]|nr:hypothetical protein [bacterium]